MQQNIRIPVSELSQSSNHIAEYLLHKLNGEIFHATTPRNWESIQLSGKIFPSKKVPEEHKNWTYNAYFANRNCVSLCDLKNNTDKEQLLFATQKYRFYLQNKTTAPQSTLLILNKSAHTNVITWKQNHIEKAYSEQIVPHLESGYPGEIDLSLITRAINVFIV